MIEPQEIRQKANNLYSKFLLAWLNGEPFFPRPIPANRKLPDNHAQAIQAVQLLRSHSKAETGFGYTIDWRERNTKRHGKNLIPEKIYFATQTDFLRFINKEREFETYAAVVETIRQQYPEMEDWLRSNRKQLLESADDLAGIILVVNYLRANPRPGKFARELPLNIDTKFIERNQSLLKAWLDRLLPPESIRAEEQHFARRYGLDYDQLRIQLRFLDEQVQQSFESPWADISIPLETLATQEGDVQRVLIVENKVCLSTLPQFPQTLALGGIGNAITELRLIPWLHHCSLWYWGDLDVDGLAILARLRRHFPHVNSILMDLETLHRLRTEFGQHQRKREISTPANLTPSERNAFQICLQDSLRIEQEQIPQIEVKQTLLKMLTTK